MPQKGTKYTKYFTAKAAEKNRQVFSATDFTDYTE
jgi:hypothetical protein